MTAEQPKVVALSGGVGGAKLVVGLAEKVEQDRLLVIANGGDDFEHLGLTICPDADTLLYAGSGLDNPKLGWGRRDETWTFMAVLGDLGGPSWFQLGDGDLALHVLRSERLRQGEPLSAITDEVRRRLGVPFRIVPMSDDPVRTWVETDEGRLPFQDWFVGRRCEPTGQRPRLRRRQRGAAGAGPGRGAGRRRARGDRDLPLESPDQRGADPGGESDFGVRSSGPRRRSSRSRRWWPVVR